MSSQPIYQRIKAELRETVARGGYEAGVPFITQRALCERFGVSNATAVRVLNDLVAEGVLIRHRGRGTFVAERPAGSGPAADRDPHRSVSFIIYDEGPHQSELFRGVSSVCLEAGFRVFVVNSKASPSTEERALRQALQFGASGVLLYPRQGEGSLPALADLRAAGIPVVLLDRHLPTFPTDAVLADNYAVGHQLTTALIARGHRRIATLWGEHQCTSVYDRSTGHIQALREHDLPILPELTALRPYVDLPEPRRKAHLSGLLSAAEPPTVLLCANGAVLATAAHDLAGLGVRIPEDLDLAGMDDAGPFDLLPLACTAAVLPSYDMGVTAAQILLDRIGSSEPYREPEHRVLPITLRSRESAQAHLTVASARMF
jgi:GntR family transcriptional regulator, arabinose operon transcriptional repressor